MNYTTLISIKLNTRDVSVSIDSDDKTWYRLNEGEEFLVGINLKIQGAVLNDDDSSEIYTDTEELLDQNRLEDICVVSGILILDENMSKEDYDI